MSALPTPREGNWVHVYAELEGVSGQRTFEQTWRGTVEVGALNASTPHGLQGHKMASVLIGFPTLDSWLPVKKKSFSKNIIG